MAVVSGTFSIAGKPSDSTGDVALQFRFALLMGVNVSAISIQFTAGSTILQASILVPSLD